MFPVLSLGVSYTVVYVVDCVYMSASRRQQLSWMKAVTSCLSE